MLFHSATKNPDGNPNRKRTTAGRKVHIASELTLLALLLSVSIGQSQTYALDWAALSGGGGISRGAGFTASATVGQAEAHPSVMTGGEFSLAGGFWSVFAVQTPGAPQLSISRMVGSPAVTVAWPSMSPGFTLQQSVDATGTNWVAVLQPVSDNGTSKFIIIDLPAGNRFYRLFKP